MRRRAEGSPRTIARKRHEPDGIPWIKWGGKIYVHVPGVRDYFARENS